MQRMHVQVLLWLTLVLLSGKPATAQPITGVSIPELGSFDTIMQAFMNSNGIVSGVLAVSTNGCVVYQRGFGWLESQDPAIPTPENTPMRVASVEKPITAAAIRRLAIDPSIDLDDALGDPVFNGGGAAGFSTQGILSIAPYDGVGDSRLAIISVGDLVNQQGGERPSSPISRACAA